MKKIILFVFTLSLLLSSCSKSSNDDSSSEPKVYQVASKASCLSNTVENSIGTYIKFDSPSFTPIANKWYKVDGGYFYYKITNITPVQGQLGQMVLVSQHYTTYCQ